MNEMLIKQARVWILATRYKTLTASFVPVFVGTLLAHQINWSLFIYTLATAVWIQIGTNFFNDVLDFKRGADTSKRLGPSRVTQQGWLSQQQMLRAAFACFAMASLFSFPLIERGGLFIAILLVISLLCGYLYTGGVAPLAYHGLGDLFVLLFFGWLSTSAAYYVQELDIDWSLMLAGAEIGLLAVVLIAINNLRDIEEDGSSNKKTLAVRWGKRFSRLQITFCASLPFLLNLLWLSRPHYFAALLPWLTLPLAVKLIANIWQTEPSQEYNGYLGQAALLHLSFGILLGIGFAIS